MQSRLVFYQDANIRIGERLEQEGNGVVPGFVGDIL
jgi:hypothetical protein